MSTEARQKIPVPRRSFLWSLNETSGEILMHVGPTEFTPSANDRIVRANGRGGFEQAPMEARAFVVARDGEYIVLENPVREAHREEDTAKNGAFIAGGNKEKELVSGTKRIIPGPCSFPLWPGQNAEVRPAHKLGANQYLLVEVVGEVEERAPYYRLVIESAGLSSAVIDQGGEAESSPLMGPDSVPTAALRLGQRIVIQGRHTQLFIPPSGIEIVPPIEESEQTKDTPEEDATVGLPPEIAAECTKLVSLVRDGMSAKQFSTMKSELRHRQDLPLGHRAIILAAIDQVFEARVNTTPAKRVDRGQRSGPTDPYARRAVVLGPKEFCILFDADGNPRIVRGPARVFPGPHDTFLQRGSRRRVYDAYELSEQQALWLRVITPVSRARLLSQLPPGITLDREEYEAGSELIVRGQPSVFFPFIEAEVVNPTTREPHVGNDHDAVIINAIGIDQKKGAYVRDLRTGMVKTIRGETSYLIDPRFEEHVQRRMARESWNLWVGHAEPHKMVKVADEKEKDSFHTPWAVAILVPNNEACLVASRHGRRVEIGPKSILLEYEESLLPFQLSKGLSKDGHHTVTTCFLRVQNARVADTFELESSDFVKLRLKLGFSGHFEGNSEAWFQVDDPVKLLADTVRARLRKAARAHTFARLVREMGKLIHDTLFEGGELRFEENGMVVDSCELLKLDIVDPALAQLFADAQREMAKLQITDEQATRRLESERHQDHVDAEEHAIVRSAVSRKAESRVIDAESDHKVELKKLVLRFDADDVELGRKQTLAALSLEEEIRSLDRRCEASVERRRKETTLDEAHLAKVTELESARARALAEAEALRLRAIQPELIGALHSAADAEVMKAAASNMNLVSLLGGKSPQELFEHLLRGTPLERTTRDMRTRSNGTNGTTDHGSPPESQKG